jgi:hypothetical protein
MPVLGHADFLVYVDAATSSVVLVAAAAMWSGLARNER